MSGRLRQELDYCVPLGIPHSDFLVWDADDQDKALAHRAEMRTICAGCGTRTVDWERDPDAFIGEIIRCPGCERLEREKSNVPNDEKGIKVGLKPNVPGDDDG